MLFHRLNYLSLDSIMKKALFISTLLTSISVFACTTFASFAGNDDSFVMAKNRDNNPDRQVIEVVAEANKYKYLALSRQDVPDFVSVGINQYNLAVFNEVTIEYSSKAVGGIADDFSKDILQNYKSVNDVIPDIPKLVAKFPDPVFYQVADGKNLLSIEVAPDHKFSYKLIRRGSFAHTNNYQIAELIKNYSYSNSEESRLVASKTRYNRALDLVSKQPNLTLDDMQKIALDRNAGNDDSIFRTGAVANNPRTSRSLAFFAIQIPQNNAAAQVKVNLYNMSEKYTYSLTAEFWKSYESGVTVLQSNSK